MESDSRRLEELVSGDFEPLAGTEFRLAVSADAEVPVVLREVTQLGHRPGAGRQPFALYFRGPSNPILAQRTYAARSERLGLIDIFIVPVGRDGDGVTYEAIFT